MRDTTEIKKELVEIRSLLTEASMPLCDLAILKLDRTLGLLSQDEHEAPGRGNSPLYRELRSLIETTARGETRLHSYVTGPGRLDTLVNIAEALIRRFSLADETFTIAEFGKIARQVHGDCKSKLERITPVLRAAGLIEVTGDPLPHGGYRNRGYRLTDRAKGLATKLLQADGR